MIAYFPIYTRRDIVGLYGKHIRKFNLRNKIEIDIIKIKSNREINNASL